MITKKYFTNIKKIIILQPSRCLIRTNAWLTDKILHRDLNKWQCGVNAVFCLFGEVGGLVLFFIEDCDGLLVEYNSVFCSCEA